MLSGYRVFSRRFVKSFPVLSGGFEIETELTIHALELGLAVAEIDTPYYARPQGSASKLNTWSDGFRILRTIIETLSRRTAAAVLHRHRSGADNCIRWNRDPGRSHLPGNRSGAAAADRRARDRINDPGVFIRRHRAGARHGDARAARDEAARLSGAPGARRGTPAALNSVLRQARYCVLQSRRCAIGLWLLYSPQTTSGPSVRKMCFTGSAWLTKICAAISAAPIG